MTEQWNRVRNLSNIYPTIESDQIRAFKQSRFRGQKVLLNVSTVTCWKVPAQASPVPSAQWPDRAEVLNRKYNIIFLRWSPQ